MSTDSGSVAAKQEKQGKASWSPLFALLGAIGIFIMAQFVLSMLFGIFFGIAGWSRPEISDWLGSTHGQFAMMAMSGVVTVGLLALLLHVRRIKFSALGLARSPQWRDVAFTIAGFFVYFGLLILATVIAGQVIGVDTKQQQEIGFEQAKGGAGGLLFVFIGLVVIPPIVEELLFRGFLYGGLRSKLPMVWAVGITSVLFAIPHLFASSHGLLWIAAIDTFALSLVLCYVREKTGALWACIGIHAVKNSLAFLVVFVIQ